MKKIILLAVVAIITLSTSAQVKYSRTFGKKESNITWYLRAGVNFNMVTGDYDEDNYHWETQWVGSEESGAFEEVRGREETMVKGKVGFDISAGFNKPFGKSPVYWGMELGFSSRGLTATNIEHDEEFDWENLDYIQSYEEGDKGNFTAYNAKLVPFMIGYKYDISKDLKLDAHIGAFVSYDFATSCDMSNDYEYDEDMKDIHNIPDGEEEFDALDAGLQLGIGAWYKRFNIDLTWQKGFMHYVDGPYVDNGGAKNSAIMVRLGVAF